MKQFACYFIVSALALGFDYALLISMVDLAHQQRLFSAAISYAAGAVLHYFLSRSFVFKPGWLNQQPRKESVAFLITGLVGLLITTCVVFIATEVISTDLYIAKTSAVGISFITIYFLRKRLVFRQTV